jgi:large subunit ribosomal protein L1
MSSQTKKRKDMTNAAEVLGAPSLIGALDFLRQYASKKFDETIEFAVKLGVDPRHADQVVRGACAMPSGLGRNVRVAVFAGSAFREKALQAGADIVGADDLADDILAGKINFDRCIATPDMMPLVGRLGKVLGPRGLMPNPKTGTVTTDVVAAVKAVKDGSVEFKCDKAGIVHVPVGKVSFTNEQLIANFRAVFDALLKGKPAGAKGTYVLGMFVSSTQGVSFPVAIKEFQA